MICDWVLYDQLKPTEIHGMCEISVGILNKFELC